MSSYHHTGNKPFLEAMLTQFYAALWHSQAMMSYITDIHCLWICPCVVIATSTKVYPGTRFTNVILPVIQIQWKIRLAITPLLAIRSQQIFAQATKAQLLCHVQNFIAIPILESRWEWNEIAIEFELRWKKRKWNGPLTSIVRDISIWLP